MSQANPEERADQIDSREISQHKISWDFGTAYDFFFSLEVLHNPEDYGLRASWAAGVRSRLAPEERKMLEEVRSFLWVPLHWINKLPAPKDAASALWALRQIPPAERTLAMLNVYEMCSDIDKVIQGIIDRRTWDETDLKAVMSCYEEHKRTKVAKTLPDFLNWLIRPEEFGELYLSALQSYYQSFFAEEEKRIAPILRQGLANAQALASKLPLSELLVELSQGVHFDESFDESDLILVPGYWNTPYVVFPKISQNTILVLFGVRPANKSLVPGEQVPDALLLVLKAMADPTRLKIMRYLSKESLTPAEISRRLRLRAPTVTHHLKALRLAGLVHLSLDSGGDKYYSVRMEAIQSTFSNLVEFLTNNIQDD